MRSSCLTALLVSMFSSQAFAEPPPISSFTRRPEITDPVISPDGRYLAVISTVDGKSVALTRDLQAGTPYVAALVVPPNADYRFNSCAWGNATRLVCDFSGAKAPESDKGGVLLVRNIVAVDADGKNFKELIGNDKGRSRITVFDVMDWTPDDPQTVLAKTSMGIRKLDIYTGALSEFNWPSNRVTTFYSDRLGAGRDRGHTTYYGRLDGQKQWTELSKIKGLWREDEIVPIAVIASTNRAYAIGAHNGRDAFFEIDLEDKRPPQLIFDHPRVDVNQPVYVNNELVGVSYDIDRPFVYYVNDQIAATMQAINKALPGAFNQIRSATTDRKKLVIASRSDVDAGSYYLYDAVNGKLSTLGKLYPDLKSDNLGRIRTVEYPANDGAAIPGYMIVPPGKRAEKLPLVVIPLEGVARRYTWHFYIYGQFLASRGYAVLLTNSRGSSGYGMEWIKAAKRDWGGLPYSDTTDGARWAVAQGIADPKRICIMGRGWGGYAALVGAVRNNDIYKCAITINGRSDMSLLASQLRGSGRERSKQEMANEVDPNKLENDAPVLHADRINIPVLLIHATLDTFESNVKQSEDMAAALTKAGKQHKLVKVEGADYLFWREPELTTVLQELEQFLAVQLAPEAANK